MKKIITDFSFTIYNLQFTIAYCLLPIAHCSLLIHLPLYFALAFAFAFSSSTVQQFYSSTLFYNFTIHLLKLQTTTSLLQLTIQMKADKKVFSVLHVVRQSMRLLHHLQKQWQPSTTYYLKT